MLVGGFTIWGVRMTLRAQGTQQEKESQRRYAEMPLRRELDLLIDVKSKLVRFSDYVTYYADVREFTPEMLTQYRNHQYAFENAWSEAAYYLTLEGTVNACYAAFRMVCTHITCGMYYPLLKERFPESLNCDHQFTYEERSDSLAEFYTAGARLEVELEKLIQRVYGKFHSIST